MYIDHMGYRGEIKYDSVKGNFVASTVNTSDVINCEADTLEELAKEFRISVHGYIEFCHEKGLVPELDRKRAE
jgi:predicted HicB family RNase H-like nuclease